MRLSHQQRASRLAYDHRLAMSIIGDLVPSVLAYEHSDAFVDKTPIRSTDQAASASLYKVEYRVRTLTGPDEFMDQCTVRFDLLSGGNYPFSAPMVTVFSRPTPWSPHFHSSGTVCIGGGWSRARGKMLLAQLVLHVAHLLNFDEPDRGRLYVGYNANAAQYWRQKYKCQPLNPKLVYPGLPLELVNSIAAPVAFKPVGIRPFAPVQAPPAITEPRAAFQPLMEKTQ